MAGGEGRRFGRLKQFEQVGGRSVLDWSLDAARSAASFVVLVLPGAFVGDPRAAGADAVVAGGETRSASVRAGLAAVPADAEIVVVHDAVRPFAAPALFQAVIEAVEGGAAGAVPGIPLRDTVKRVADGHVTVTLDRTDLVAVQTPQAFRAGTLRRAHEGAPEATDDAALIEALGGQVAVVPGEARNIKLTSPDDLLILEAWSRP